MSPTAKGLTTGQIAAHIAHVYVATVSKDTILRITDKVVGEMTEWCNRPLESVYPAVFIDAISVKIRDGQVTNRPIATTPACVSDSQHPVHVRHLAAPDLQRTVGTSSLSAFVRRQ
jgi:transposase-like protein